MDNKNSGRIKNENNQNKTESIFIDTSDESSNSTLKLKRSRGLDCVIVSSDDNNDDCKPKMRRLRTNNMRRKIFESISLDTSDESDVSSRKLKRVHNSDDDFVVSEDEDEYEPKKKRNKDGENIKNTKSKAVRTRTKTGITRSKKNSQPKSRIKKESKPEENEHEIKEKGAETINNENLKEVRIKTESKRRVIKKENRLGETDDADNLIEEESLDINSEEDNKDVKCRKDSKQKSDLTNKQESSSKSKRTVKTETNLQVNRNEGNTEGKSSKNFEKTSFADEEKFSRKFHGKEENSFKSGFAEYSLLAEKENINAKVAQTVIKLFESGNTIPFIARYRRHLTEDMCPEKLRNVKNSYEEICALKTKAENVLKTIEKAGKLSPDLENSVRACKSLSELEHIYAPFKQGGQRTLADRAKKLGLENPALSILTGEKEVYVNLLVKPEGPEGLKSESEVEKGLIHIIAHKISIDTEVLKFIRTFRPYLKIESKKSSSAKENDPEVVKFERYFNFQISVNYIRPHQVLALNRGENLKILSVKVVVPDYSFTKFKKFCQEKWLRNSRYSKTRFKIVEEAIQDSYKRHITPLISRQTRAELKSTAEVASTEVFAVNLKKLLLGTPLKGKTIMGIDPGLKVGCKAAVVSPFGDVLATGVLYPHTKKSAEDKETVRSLLLEHNCSLIALGNGTACRQTETWLTEMIQYNFFYPLDVSYTIVDESGASVYSCSAEAKKEFPSLDPLIISAISLARRVQDPLAELVKVDPKSLGVGMYQHDLNKKTLESALSEVVSECVSFVGVDLNTASHCLLTRVAGLTSKRAESILQHRSTKGPFTNRYQLKDVKGIGEKVFEQCAGFLRVGPLSTKDSKDFYERPDTMPLDCTWIHPESYDLAEKIIRKFNLTYKQIGQSEFIKKIRASLNNSSVEQLSKEFEESVATIKLITDVLCRPLDHDLRAENPQEPLFRKGITTMEDLRVNMELTGRVENVVHFGAFVDIGVGKSGLIHTTGMRGFNIELGERVKVRVIKLEKQKSRIALEVLNKF